MLKCGPLLSSTSASLDADLLLDSSAIVKCELQNYCLESATRKAIDVSVFCLSTAGERGVIRASISRRPVVLYNLHSIASDDHVS